ncbi:hypothetical protein EJV47_06755 [Hymenobacter gummosus]|uniref:TonB C-terminal domain-containing protein n=1 Tax=Hymenobacter gummosus TaxID=1776032 RepID=A0A431U564_9BACT|nr:energy transducer TonB [Hymenobacter gummosus]RTQ51495.1 hypothetical protein EJV47_06755 [Hymenobacter gummosus]
MPVHSRIPYGLLTVAGLLLGSCQGPAESPTEVPADAALATPDPPRCAQGMVEALRDFGQGHYQLHSVEFQPPDSRYLAVLAERYHIGWRFVESAAPGTYYGCYDSLMLGQLQKRYGPDFLARAQQMADSLDAISPWSAYPDFPGGVEALQAFIYSRLNWQLAPALPDTAGRPCAVHVQFRLDERGRVQQPQVLKGLDAAHNQEALRVVRRLPRWQPAYQRGRPIAITYTLIVRFSRANQTRYQR